MPRSREGANAGAIVREGGLGAAIAMRWSADAIYERSGENSEGRGTRAVCVPLHFVEE